MSNIFQSSRFWLIFITAVMQLLVIFKVIENTQAEAAIHVVQTFLISIVAVRTVDKHGGN